MQSRFLVSRRHRANPHRRELLADRNGSVMVIVAFAMTALIGFVALAIDVGTWYALRGRLQTAADAAAYAGVVELSRPQARDVNVLASARDLATRNGFGPSSNATMHAAIVNNRTAVEVSISEPGPLFFSALFLSEGPLLRRRAVASLVGEEPPCLLALDPTGARALELIGAAGIDAPGCKIWVNSTHPAALYAQGAPHVDAKEICVAGAASGRTGGLSPVPTTACAPKPDPLAGLPGPSIGACDVTSPVVAAGGVLPRKVYCGGVTIAGDVALEPGLYAFRDKGITIAGNNSLRGDGVTLYFEGQAAFSASGTADVYLKAPKQGVYAGITIFQDRNAPLGVKSVFGGNSGKHYEGAVYMPNSHIEFYGSGAGSTTSPYSMFIAHRFTFRGAGSVAIGSDYGHSDVKPPAGMFQRLALTQ